MTNSSPKYHELQKVLENPRDLYKSISDTRIGNCIENVLLGKAEHHDLAVLIRQSLRKEFQQRFSETALEFQRVSFNISTDLFPEDFNFKKFGLKKITSDSSHISIYSKPWNPTWMTNPTPEIAIDEYVSSFEERRADQSLFVDPFFQKLDQTVSTYRTPGQKEAIRSAVFSEPGSTLLFNLPTASGKTNALLGPVLAAPENTTSLVIVPTIALALDQEKRYQEQTNSHLQSAYHSGLTNDERRDFKQRINNGNQKVIFTNPEQVFTSLATPLTEAARKGLFAVLAIDEVHILASWGESFRPEFQALVGF